LFRYKVYIVLAFLQLTCAVSTACEHQGVQISMSITQLLTVPGKQWSTSKVQCSCMHLSTHRAAANRLTTRPTSTKVVQCIIQLLCLTCLLQQTHRALCRGRPGRDRAARISPAHQGRPIPVPCCLHQPLRRRRGRCQMMDTPFYQSHERIVNGHC